MMELIFDKDRFAKYECSCEVLVNGFVMQCRQRTDTIVQIPRGLHYFDGNLKWDARMFGATLSICAKHESRLKIQFAELMKGAATGKEVNL